MTSDKSDFKGDAINWFRGLCMGAADIVPGVSGGTMALILGHYQRLIQALASFDRKFVEHVLHRRIKQAWGHIDGRFLLGLGLGVVSGVLALASLLNYLLENQQASVYAAFSGLIMGSCFLVGKRLVRWEARHIFSAVLGAAVAIGICLVEPSHTGLTPLTAFVAAAIAICAMILPGISGAFILLLMGLYHPITDLIKGLPRGEVGLQGLITLACFAAGCGFGLLAFTRVLKQLLNRAHDMTMAFLTGLMVGSLWKIWPFQRATEETAMLEFKERQFKNLWPSEAEDSLLWVVSLVVVAFIFTLLLDRLGKSISDGTAKDSMQSAQ